MVHIHDLAIFALSLGSGLIGYCLGDLALGRGAMREPNRRVLRERWEAKEPVEQPRKARGFHVKPSRSAMALLVSVGVVLAAIGWRVEGWSGGLRVWFGALVAVSALVPVFIHPGRER